MTTVRLTDEQWEKMRKFLRADPHVYVGEENDCISVLGSGAIKACESGCRNTPPTTRI